MGCPPFLISQWHLCPSHKARFHVAASSSEPDMSPHKDASFLLCVYTFINLLLFFLLFFTPSVFIEIEGSSLYFQLFLWHCNSRSPRPLTPIPSREQHSHERVKLKYERDAQVKMTAYMELNLSLCCNGRLPALRFSIFLMKRKKIRNRKRTPMWLRKLRKSARQTDAAGNDISFICFFAIIRGSFSFLLFLFSNWFL